MFFCSTSFMYVKNQVGSKHTEKKSELGNNYFPD